MSEDAACCTPCGSEPMGCAECMRTLYTVDDADVFEDYLDSQDYLLDMED
jgi:hypothetical protein